MRYGSIKSSNAEEREYKYMAEELDNKISLRFTYDESHRISIATTKQRVSKQAVGHELFMRWLEWVESAGARTTSISSYEELAVEDAGDAEIRLVAYMRHIATAKPKELSVMEQALQVFASELYQLSEIEKKRRDLKVRRRPGNSLLPG